MNLTNERLKLILNDSKLRDELLNYADYSNIDLDNLGALNDESFRKLEEGVLYVVQNCFDLILTFETPPLMEMEPPPILIYKGAGLFVVHEQWLDSNETNYFDTENDALEFARAANETFMSIYRVIVSED